MQDMTMSEVLKDPLIRQMLRADNMSRCQRPRPQIGGQQTDITRKMADSARARVSICGLMQVFLRRFWFNLGRPKAHSNGGPPFLQ